MKSAVILAAIDEVTAAKDVHSIEAALLELARACGFIFFGVIRQPKPHEDPMGLVLTGRFPEGWPELYIAKKYVLIDPTIRYLGHAQRGFRWRDTVSAFASDPQIRRMARMMQDARRFGLEDGYVFPVHGRRGLVGTMTFGGAAVDLSPREMTLFEGLAKTAFWRLLALGQPDLNETLSAATNVKLSHREMEALHYLSDGMTSPEIAAVLKISNHTVDWYMNGIQQKLQAKNRHHTVAIAFRIGLIS